MVFQFSHPVQKQIWRQNPKLQHGNFLHILVGNLFTLCFISSYPTVSMRSLLFWDVTQHGLVVSHQGFGATYQSHLQGSISQRSMPGTLRYEVIYGMVWAVIGSQGK